MARGRTKRRWLVGGGVTILLLSALYAYLAKAFLADRENEPAIATSAIPLPTPPNAVGVPSANPPNNKAQAEITWEELANRWFRVSGTVPNTLLQSEVEAATKQGMEAADQWESTLRARADCADAPWLEIVPDLPFARLRSLRGSHLLLNREGLAVKGVAASEQEKAVLEDSLKHLASRMGLAATVALTVEPPARSRVTLWMGPDRTLLVGGTVGEGQRAGVLAALQKALPQGTRLVSDLMESRFADAPEWIERLPALIPAFLGSAKVTRVEVQGNKVILEGLAEPAGVTSLRRLVSNAFPAPLYELESRLRLGVRTDSPPPTKGQAEDSRLAELAASTKVYYTKGATKISQLKRAERSKLDKLAKAWRRGQALYLSGTLEGTADPEKDQRVTRERCEAIVDYLAENGVAKDELHIEAGPSKDEQKGPDARLVQFRVEGTAIATTTPGPPANLQEIHVADLLPKTVIYFASKARLEPDEKVKLDRLGAALVAENVAKKILLYGYSDGKGSPEANLWMTEERCKAVRNYLVSLGLREDLLITRPVNAPAIVVDDTASAPKREEPAKLRRVEFGFEEEATPAPAAEPAPPPTEPVPALTQPPPVSDAPLPEPPPTTEEALLDRPIVPAQPVPDDEEAPTER